MPVFSVAILRRISSNVPAAATSSAPEKSIFLSAAHDVSSFGYFTRSSVREFLMFTSRTMVTTAYVLERTACVHKGYMCFYFVAESGLACSIITSVDYPKRVAFGIISDLLDNFEKAIPSSKWQSCKEMEITFPYLNAMLEKAQDPSECDKIGKIMKALDETKVVLHETLEKALDRKHKLDELVSKSEDLSTLSKGFFEQSQAMNSSCCIVQ